MVLLDSEGIDSVRGEGLDDNQIFTLTVLLASVLICNSAGEPTRHDHRRTSRGGGGAAAPPVSENFGQNAQNSGKKKR